MELYFAPGEKLIFPMIIHKRKVEGKYLFYYLRLPTFFESVKSMDAVDSMILLTNKLVN